MKRTLLIISLGVILSVFSFGQTKLTENTLRLEKGKPAAAANPSIMNWMVGNWTGEAFGGKVSETWTRLGEGILIGMFALVKDNKPVFYEFMSFTEENGECMLKLKHFHPNLVSWEEKEKTTNFRFIKKDGNRFYFSGLTFENNGKNNLTIYLALTQNGKTSEEIFRFVRSDLK